jgi:hypothetical protein
MTRKNKQLVWKTNLKYIFGPQRCRILGQITVLTQGKTIHLYILCESITKACAVNWKVARTTTWWELDESMSFTFCYCFCTLSPKASQFNSPQTLILIKFYGIEKSGKWNVKFLTNKVETSFITTFNQFEINKADLCSDWKVVKTQLTHDISI